MNIKLSSKPRAPTVVKEKINIDSIDWNNWSTTLDNSLDLLQLGMVDDPEEIWKSFRGCMAKVNEDCAEKKNSTIHSKPFWTKELQKTLEHYQDARKDYSKRNTDLNYHLLQRAQDTFNETRKEECRKFIIQQTTGLNTAQCKEFWKSFNRLFGKSGDPCVEPLLLKNGQLLTESAEIEEELFQTFFGGKHMKDHIKSFDDKFQKKVEKEYEEIIETETRKAKDSKIPPAGLNAFISIEEIVPHLKKTTGKSFDDDNIHPKMLKHLGPRAIWILHHLFNRVLLSRNWIWDMADVIFLKKEGKKDYSDPAAYRPISITSYVGKIMEKIMAVRFNNHLLSLGITDPNQEGFTKARNTNRYLNRLNLSISKDREKKLTVMALFLDFSKAFDSVWKKGLIVKLWRAGVSGNFLLLLDSFLGGRKVRLHINGFVGLIRLCLEIGVPQGSALSPILFKFFIFDICCDLDPKYEVYKFADDGSIKVSEPTTILCLQSMERVTASLNCWTSQWRMIINCSPDKTEMICFCTAEGDRSLVPNTISIGSQEIKVVQKTRVLGLTIDENQTFESHAKAVLNKIQFRWVMICKYTNRNWGLNQRVLINLTRTLLTPCIFYAGLVWLTPKLLEDMKQIWYKVNKTAVGAVFNVSQTTSEIINGLAPLRIQNSVNRVKHYLKLLMFSTQDDPLMQLVKLGDSSLLSAHLREVYSFLVWKAKKYPLDITAGDSAIIERKDYASFNRLGQLTGMYTKSMMKKFTEEQWQKAVDNEYQMLGTQHSPIVSTNQILIPRGTPRDVEVLVLSMFYKNNLLNVFLHKLYPLKYSSELCSCKMAAQTSYHVIMECKEMDCDLRESLKEILEETSPEGQGWFEDEITLLNHSRNNKFTSMMVKGLHKNLSNHRLKIVLPKPKTVKLPPKAASNPSKS